MPTRFLSGLLTVTAFLSAQSGTSRQPIRPGHPEWPVAWSSYRTVESLETDFADLKAHGVGLVSINANDAADARRKLELARRFGMKYHIRIPEATEHAELARDAGVEPAGALMIGGVYQGKAIDRHLYRFSPEPHTIVIEPPVYNQRFAYTLGSRGTGAPAAGEPIGHYFPDMPDPVRAEIVVALKPFDGGQHLKIVPARISPAPANTKLDADSVTPDMPASSETAKRKLYRLTFDLSGLDGAMLDQVGVAVYWPYHGSEKYWMFGRGNLSAAAQSTRAAQRKATREALRVWIEANGGVFPSDVVLAARVGDECFYTTGHLQPDTPAVNYPLWEFSAPSIEAFRRHAGKIEYPRTWGYPAIYGPAAYGWWMYTFHESCAAVMGVTREEVSRIAPGLLLFRNTTRAGVFSLSNDRDGSGPELLARNLDIAHLDPYPVGAGGYSSVIPRDMSYYAGLARRYNRLLVPWMQAHIYQNLRHVSPEQVDRMAGEQFAHGPDAIMWLGYGDTFPKVRPDSWERAAAVHKRFAASPPAKPEPRLAVVRSYTPWALTSYAGGLILNPGDWMLQQFLEVWAVEHSQPYDVFETPPAMTAAQRATLSRQLARYPLVVSTETRDGAWVVGGDAVQPADPSSAAEVRRRFAAEMGRRGWLK